MNNETQMFCGDSAEELLKIKDNSVDMLCTDPPYGYSFMNKGWDKVLPDTDIWINNQEIRRIHLKLNYNGKYNDVRGQ